MSEKSKAFDPIIDFTSEIRNQKLPFVLLVGLPSTGEIIRLCNGMESAGNRETFRGMFSDLLALQEKGKAT